jgi:hypothetical protein
MQHSLQMSLGIPGQGEEASIGIVNMDKKTFDAVRDAYPEEFAETSWEEIRDAPILGLKAMAYRMKYLDGQLPERSGSGSRHSRQELLDFGYRGTPDAMRSVASGREEMSQHGNDHLKMFRSKFPEADKVICGSGYWVCG